MDDNPYHPELVIDSKVSHDERHDIRGYDMDTITISGVEIDIADGPISISLSGGADSALLLYILMSHHPGTIHAFTCASEMKFRANARVAQQVVQRCIELTGNDNVMHHTYFVKQQDDDKLFTMQCNYRDLGLFNTIYTAVTANPPAEIAYGFGDLNTQHAVRDPLVTRSTRSARGFWVPFTNIDKRKVNDMYREQDLLEDLFPITRSCESLEIDAGHCGKCWWCQERQWGFGRLE